MENNTITINSRYDVLNLLDEPVRSQAITNTPEDVLFAPDVRKIQKSDVARLAIAFIQGGFIWTSAPEGWEYWNKVTFDGRANQEQDFCEAFVNSAKFDKVFKAQQEQVAAAETTTASSEEPVAEAPEQKEPTGRWLTLKTVVNMFAEPFRSKVLVNGKGAMDREFVNEDLKTEPDGTIFRTMVTALMCAFKFEESPEGSEYWMEIIMDATKSEEEWMRKYVRQDASWDLLLQLSNEPIEAIAEIAAEIAPASETATPSDSDYTIREGLMMLEEPHRTQAMKNVYADVVDKLHVSRTETNPYRVMRKCLFSAFDWEATPEGHDYWCELITNLLEKEAAHNGKEWNNSDAPSEQPVSETSCDLISIVKEASNSEVSSEHPVAPAPVDEAVAPAQTDDEPSEAVLDIKVGDKVVLKSGLVQGECYFGRYISYDEGMKNAAERGATVTYVDGDSSFTLGGFWIPFEYVESVIRVDESRIAVEETVAPVAPATEKQESDDVDKDEDNYNSNHPLEETIKIDDIQVGDTVGLKPLQNERLYVGWRYISDMAEAAANSLVGTVDRNDNTICIDGWWIPLAFVATVGRDGKIVAPAEAVEEAPAPVEEVVAPALPKAFYTVRDGLMMLDEPYRSQAIEQAFPAVIDSPHVEGTETNPYLIMRRCMACCFSWTSSKEGRDYWQKYNSELLEKQLKHDQKAAQEPVQEEQSAPASAPAEPVARPVGKTDFSLLQQGDTIILRDDLIEEEYYGGVMYINRMNASPVTFEQFLSDVEKETNGRFYCNENGMLYHLNMVKEFVPAEVDKLVIKEQPAPEVEEVVAPAVEQSTTPAAEQEQEEEIPLFTSYSEQKRMDIFIAAAITGLANRVPNSGNKAIANEIAKIAIKIAKETMTELSNQPK